MSSLKAPRASTRRSVVPRGRTRALLGAGLCAALIAPASAGADVDGWTFEPPKFAPGNINGQDGWLKTGPYDFEVMANPAPLQANFGAQSLRASNSVTSGSFSDQLYSDS